MNAYRVDVTVFVMAEDYDGAEEVIHRVMEGQDSEEGYNGYEILGDSVAVVVLGDDWATDEGTNL